MSVLLPVRMLLREVGAAELGFWGVDACSSGEEFSVSRASW